MKTLKQISLWKYLPLTLLWSLFFTPCGAQNCIVEDWTISIVSNDMTSMTVQQKKVLTIVNQQGTRHAAFVCSCSKKNKLSSFHGIVTDGSGQVVREIKKSELLRTEYSPYLAVDDYKMYYDYTPPTFPVTITYEWTMECRDNVIEYPWFCPQDDYEVSVRHAAYRLQVPKEQTVRHTQQNISTQVTRTEEKKMQVLSLQMSDLPALHREPFARPLHERIPLAFFAPQQFVYYGEEGHFNDWKEYGQWEFSLLQGRDELPAAVREKLHQMTDGLPNDRDKVERVYRFLGETTRYVAILLGIGGQQPATAEQVAESGFGDCKGLTNYMCAMLKEIGISSSYTVISMDHRRLMPDFASVGQMNHVILQVPLPGDTIWIECTNPRIPFGYVHEDIAGHDAVTVNADGGQIVRLPVYADTANVEKNAVQVTLTPDGTASIQLKQETRCRQMEDRLPLSKMDKNDLHRALQRMVHAPQNIVSNSQVSIDGLSLHIQATMNSQKYASANGMRLFVPLYPIRHGHTTLKSDTLRTEDIVISYGYVDEDDVTFIIPEGYEIEAMPSDTIINSTFGTFSIQLTVNANTVRVNRRLLLKAGTYPAEQYLQLFNFFQTAVNSESQKMVLKKISGTL